MKQKSQCFHPKVPNRPQRGREQGEKQRCASGYPQQHIDAQLPLRPVEREQEQRGGGGQTVGAVQRPGAPGQTESEGAQQIVGQAHAKSQQNGLEEDLQLLVDKVPHIIPAAAAAALHGLRMAPHRIGSRSSPPPSIRRPPARAGRCAGLRR